MQAQLTDEVTHLQASADELHEEVSPLENDTNKLFDEYQVLKEDHDSLLLQLTEKDDTIQGLLVYRKNFEADVIPNGLEIRCSWSRGSPIRPSCVCKDE